MDAVNTLGQRRAVQQRILPIIRAPLFWQLAALGTVSVASKVWLGAQSDPGSSIQDWGIVAPFVAVTLQGTTSMTPMGSSLIPVLNGMLFPLLLAVVLNLVGGVAGSVGMYYIWRRGERELQIRERLRALPPWARRFTRDDLSSLIIMRMLPWAGGNLANLIAGAHHVPLRVHILGVAIGSLPGSIIYASLGAGIISL